MKTLKLGLGLTFCLLVAGCQSLEDDVDDCLFSLKYRIQAHQRWWYERPNYPNVRYRQHYGCGFRAGYRDVATGGSGCLPPMPPRKYSTVWYQSPAGHEKIYEWYNGFSSGAATAMQESANRWATVPPSPQFAYSTQVLKDGRRNGGGQPTPIPDVPPAPAAASDPAVPAAPPDPAILPDPPDLEVPDVPKTPPLPVPHVPGAPAARGASPRPFDPAAPAARGASPRAFDPAAPAVRGTSPRPIDPVGAGTVSIPILSVAAGPELIPAPAGVVLLRELSPESEQQPSPIRKCAAIESEPSGNPAAADSPAPTGKPSHLSSPSGKQGDSSKQRVDAAQPKADAVVMPGAEKLNSADDKPPASATKASIKQCLHTDASADADGRPPTLGDDSDGKPRVETTPPRQQRVSVGEQSREESNDATKDSE